MQQTKLVSGIEAAVNIGTGFIISFGLWIMVAPWFGWETTVSQSASLTSIFTVTSLARSYLWRRFFNNGFHQVTVDVVRRLLT